MRTILVLSLLLLPVAAQEASLASKFPAGATAYFEVTGLAQKLEALEDSALGRSIKNHPALVAFQASEQGKVAEARLNLIQQMTGFDRKGLVRALFGDRLALAMYGPKRFLAAIVMDAQSLERVLAGVEKTVPMLRRYEAIGAGENLPPLMGIGPLFYFHDGKRCFLSPDRLLAVAARGGDATGLAADARFKQARAGADEGLLFGYVNLEAFAKLKAYDKPNELGQALLFGAFAHYLPDAPWAAMHVDLERDGDDWKLVGEGVVPVPEKSTEPVESSYRGTLEPLPFALPERTVGVIRMRRSLASIWSNREALIAKKGIPGLIQFETNFGNLAGGLSWVEEVLPNCGDELILVGTRRVFAEGKPAPAVRFPQGALLLPLKNTEALGNRLQVAFNNTIAILNLQQNGMGYNFLTVATEYKGIRILQAEYMTATKAEMESKTTLPPRFNLAPACATVGRYFVIASHGDIVKELIDNYGKPGQAPDGVNAGFWLRPGEARTLLAENREPMIAQAMVNDGLGRAEAEGRIGLLMDAAGYVKSFELTSRESRATVGVRMELGLEVPR